MSLGDTVQFASGKYLAAKDFYTRAVESMKKVEPDAKPFLLQPLSGEMREIAFMVMYSSLAAYNEGLTKRQTEPEYQALVKEWRTADWPLDRQVRLFNILE